jgi:hypothetical protein
MGSKRCSLKQEKGHWRPKRRLFHISVRFHCLAPEFLGKDLNLCRLDRVDMEFTSREPHSEMRENRRLCPKEVKGKSKGFWVGAIG